MATTLLDNLAHHFAVARAALAEERQKAKQETDKRRAKRHELEFMPAVLEVVETPASPLGRAVALSICGFFVIAVAWATIGEIDIIATALGKIIPSERVKQIQPLETGVIRAIHVVDGANVRKGDLLIELDPTGSEADRERLTQDLLAARVEMARLTALLTNNPEQAYAPPQEAPKSLIELHRSFLVSQVQQLLAKKAALEGEIAKRQAEIRTNQAGVKRLENKLGKVRERVEGNRTLYEKGVLAKLKFAELEQEFFDIEGQLEVEKQRLTESHAALRAAEAQYRQMEAEVRRDIHAEMAEVRKRANAAEQELIKAAERNRLQRLVSPVDGMVQQLAVHTVGGVVTPAQPLMQIVPATAELEIEAMVQNKDIGFVRQGQEALIKVESFPFTRYGTIDGTVRQVYVDAVKDEKIGLIYPARITMARTTMQVDDKTVNLTPGMAVTVEIKTGKRRVIEYILAPLQRYQSESMREQ